MRSRLTLFFVVAATVGATSAIAFGGSGGSASNTGPVAQGGAGSRVVGDERWVVCNGHVAIGDPCHVRGRGVVSSSHLAAGAYEVLFNLNVRNCGYTATVGDYDASGTEPPGEITTVGRISSTRGVFITTHDSAGAQTDRSFHLHVIC